MERLLDEATADWREGFGTLPPEESADLERITKEVRTGTSEGVAARQADALEELSNHDETA